LWIQEVSEKVQKQILPFIKGKKTLKSVNIWKHSNVFLFEWTLKIVPSL